MSPAARFVPLARLLHWLMALLLLAQLLVGVAMMASLTLRPPLIALHRPLGLALLVLVLLRLWVRRCHPPPALPADLPRWQAAAARASHLLLYALMLALPLLGWALTSAAGNVVLLPGAVQLPAIAPRDPLLYAWLRDAHGLLAWVLLASVLGHLAAALHHAWVRRDGVFEAMAGGRPLPPPGAD
ncbi:cytochrome b [Thermomonas fusca]|uniref:Cytochrome b n=1 Tax=Thermomonas fusca TaxID=215690 RepID=A0A5R9PH61_9GAMM|nr:cytochrome b/b6 domain-containing protein [Thermomonas fusca]TLX22861.1 cytochrome b [Thermomonas fusca]